MNLLNLIKDLELTLLQSLPYEMVNSSRLRYGGEKTLIGKEVKGNV